MDTPVFVTELMGVTFYCHLYSLFDEVLADEPEVRDRLKELLDEITIDEVAHVCQSALKSIHLTASNNVQQESKVMPFLAPFYAA
jgi:hypothetical protein